MTTIGDNRILAQQQHALRQDFRRAMRDLAGQMRPVLIAAAGDDGDLTFAEYTPVISRVGGIVMRFFADASGDTFTERGVALAPFGQLISRHYARTVWLAVAQHHLWMRDNLDAETFDLLANPDLVRAPAILPAATVARLIREKAAQRVAQMRIAEEDEGLPVAPQPGATPEPANRHLRLFRPNPLAGIDPERLWVRWHEPRQIINDFGEVRSYRLSDAVWQAGDATRQKINEVIQKGIAQGRSAVHIAETLEDYLLPRQRAFRTFNPYGVKYMGPEGAASSAMRIARTEISYAFNQANYTAALHNPWVDKIRWVLSPAHPRVDICDDIAGEYPIRVAKIPPAHPYCLCHSENVVSGSAADIQNVARDIRRELDLQRNNLLVPVMTTAMIDEFVAALINDHLLQFTGVPVGYIPSAVVVPF